MWHIIHKKVRGIKTKEMQDLANTMFDKLSMYKRLKDGKFEEVIKNNNLRKIDVEILFYLDRCGERDTAGNIAETGRFTKGHISQSTKRLSQMGYISSRKDENDLRISHLSLTEKSRAIINEMYHVRTETFEDAFKGVSEEELQIVKRVCEIVCNNISKELK